MQNEDTLTFLQRAPKIKLGPLPLPRVSEKYQECFGITKEVAWEMSKLTKGFPYAFQTLGYYYFENDHNINIAAKLCKNDVCDYVYEKIWSGLSEVDRQILIAMTNSGSENVKDIRTAAGMKPNQFSPYRDRLVRRGLVDGNEYGKLKLALPFIEEFIREKVEYESL